MQHFLSIIPEMTRSLASELGVLCALAGEEYPNPRVFGFRKIRAKGVNHEQTGTR